MKRIVLFSLLALLSFFALQSCKENMAYVLIVQNQSSVGIEQIGLWYTGVKGPPPDFTVAVSIPALSMQSVVLTLDPGTNYYNMIIRDATSLKYLTWYVGVGGERVLLSKDGSSTCTITDDPATCTAGENLAHPFEYNWP